MENKKEFLKSRENPNLRIMRYTSYVYDDLYEIYIELNNSNRTKYPLLFSISKRCEEAKLEETNKKLMSIVDAEFPGNTWQLL